MLSPPNGVSKGVMFWAVRPPRSSILSFIQTDLLTRYLMNGFSNLNETYREYSLARIDDFIRLWRSKVKVTAGCQCGEDIHTDASQSPSSSSELLHGRLEYL